jgi:hypothetical protein
MKKLLCLLTLALLTASPRLSRAQNTLEKDPAYLAIDKALDLQTIRPEVSVNLPRFLLQNALAEFNGGPDDPFAKSGINVADLIKDIKLIRVVVIEANDTNRAALKKGVAKLRSSLESKWISVASVPEENVGVYALGDPSGEKMAGLAVLVFDGGDAVIGNIVGDVSLAKVLKVATHMNKLPKDLIKKLTEASKPKETGAETEKKTKKSEEPAPAAVSK